MGRPRYRFEDRISLGEIFRRVQDKMLADLTAGKVFEHLTARGTAGEQRWIDLFNRYLPQRYLNTRAFIIDADGHRSRQIDIAIYDRFFSPLFFHDPSQPYIPVESVYAVFEVKQTLGPLFVLDAGRKAASVRQLRRTSAAYISGSSVSAPKPAGRIVAGVLSLDACWKESLAERMTPLLADLRDAERLDLGCVLRQGAFESGAENGLRFAGAEEALIFFMLRLMSRLQEMGAAPAIDWAEYSKSLS